MFRRIRTALIASPSDVFAASDNAAAVFFSTYLDAPAIGEQISALADTCLALPGGNILAMVRGDAALALPASATLMREVTCEPR